MATIHVDGKSCDVEEGQTLLAACLTLGFNIPYFCWHPAMQSIGSCRLCAVKTFRDEHDTRGRITMSCMTAVSEGLRVSVEDPEVKEFRASVLEWLMINHPHDCPVCDEGGECHLQDMTVMTGHVYRRYRYKKDTHHNQYLGPFINHEMNRCIQCYRCVRFYRDYTGGRDFDVFGAHNKLYFGRLEPGVLESEFSGNLVEICPTGVFTDKTSRKHFTRKWDLQTAPSVCVHCGLGCNTIPGERYGTLRRIRNRYNGNVNGYFLCDRGRFGYEFVNSENRIKEPLMRNEAGELEPCSPDRALNRFSELLGESAGTIGVGSPRASLESNYALKKLVGDNDFSAGIPSNELELVNLILEILRNGAAPSATLPEVENSDAVFVLGEDFTNTAPRLALAVRQSTLKAAAPIARLYDVPDWNDRSFRLVAEDNSGPVLIASPLPTGLDDIAKDTFNCSPEDIARIGFSIAGELDEKAPHVTDLDDQAKSWASRAAEILRNAERPLIISGASCRDSSVLQASANVAKSLKELGRDCRIALVAPECNTMGSGLLDGNSLENVFEKARSQETDLTILVENDLYRRVPREAADEFLTSCQNLVVIDHVFSETVKRADLVLPAATFAEATGTLVNSEGRAQRFIRVMDPSDRIRESWKHVRDAMRLSEPTEADAWGDYDSVVASLSEKYTDLRLLGELAPGADFRILNQKIGRQSHRYSGRTAMHANVSVHEPKPPDDPDSPLAFSTEGYQGIPPSSLVPRYWAPGWNSVQSLNKFQSEVGGEMVGGDPGIRLIEPSEETPLDYFLEAPAVFEIPEGQWRVVPVHHVFGSDELSVLSPGILELTPEPYVGLNSDDAEKMHIQDGDLVSIEAGDKTVRLPVRIVHDLPRSMLAWPVGLPGVEVLDHTRTVRVTPVASGPEEGGEADV
jgi:NADH-quinone oxidoreductase subunit G